MASTLLAQGRQPEAIALVSRAASGGDAAAVCQQAVWHLIGSPLPRDLAKARMLLRRACAFGHVDAALMEIALVANGAGAPTDWLAALDLLRSAAERDPVAANQLALVKAMALAADGSPSSRPAGEALDDEALVTRVPAFLTNAECDHVMQASAPWLQPSLVVDPRNGRQMQHPIRTSDSMMFGPTREDLVVRAIDLRLAAVSDTDVAQGEALTVLRYGPGQQYRMHLDTLPATSNQRTKTVLIYLNDGFVGGETIFPDLGLSIQPRRGEAIVFRNTRLDGTADPRSRHAGVPVTCGVKWLATRWIRERPFDPWIGPEQTRPGTS